MKSVGRARPIWEQTMYESYKALKLERRGKILSITIDNPPMNAMTPQTHNELSRIFGEINHDRETAVVVLTGGGTKAFSAGGDIGLMIDRIDSADHAGWNQSMTEAKHIVNGLLRLEKPIIGRINGHAMGLGSTLAVLCDFTYMMAGARFADTHVKIGLTAGDGGALMWPLLIGFAKAKHYLLTGEAMTGRQAAEIGLIGEAVETVEELDEKVWARAEQLACGAGLAINTTKMAINLILRNLLEGMIETHLGYETMTAWSGDHREAAYAFRDKREPNFTGD
jgi:enoyl-CoA hydratase